MADKLHIEVVTLRQAVLSDDVQSVTLPGVLGEFKVLPNHRPFLTSLKPGRLEIEGGGGTRAFYLAGGFAEILSGRVLLLADECIAKEDLDLGSVKTAVDDAAKALEEHRTESIDETAGLRKTYEQAKAQLLVAQG